MEENWTTWLGLVIVRCVRLLLAGLHERAINWTSTITTLDHFIEAFFSLPGSCSDSGRWPGLKLQLVKRHYACKHCMTAEQMVERSKTHLAPGRLPTTFWYCATSFYGPVSIRWSEWTLCDAFALATSYSQEEGSIRRRNSSGWSALSDVELNLIISLKFSQITLLSAPRAPPTGEGDAGMSAGMW
uniref:Putative secreted peptide n=1 Tax=Anopheles braziliensis TaxID=58242 RepID=A0A2M3ZPS8_9DIPT